jgi:hypothetical protein
MENEFVKWEAIIDDNNINIKDLPENVQHKIERFETLFEDYDEIDETDESNENTLSRMEDELLAMDNGICGDLKSYLASKKSSEPSESDKKEDGGETKTTNQPQPNNTNNSDKPSWAFWM